jgi:hypothetical protein
LHKHHQVFKKLQSNVITDASKKYHCHNVDKHDAYLTFNVLFIYFFQICSSSRSQGIFELHLKSFENKPGKDSAGQCCDGFKTSTGVCSGFCATRFRVCLKHYQATIDPKHECTFGERFTPVLANNTIQSMPKQVIEFPIDFKWPVRT